MRCHRIQCVPTTSDGKPIHPIAKLRDRDGRNRSSCAVRQRTANGDPAEVAEVPDRTLVSVNNHQPRSTDERRSGRAGELATKALGTGKPSRDEVLLQRRRRSARCHAPHFHGSVVAGGPGTRSTFRPSGRPRIVSAAKGYLLLAMLAARVASPVNGLLCRLGSLGSPDLRDLAPSRFGLRDPRWLVLRSFVASAPGIKMVGRSLASFLALASGIKMVGRSGRGDREGARCGGVSGSEEVDAAGGESRRR